jgi:hypothetical protein
LPAERSRWQGEKHLLAQHVLDRKTAFFIVPDFGIGGRDGVLGTRSVNPGGAEKQVELLVELLGDRIEAPGAGHFEITLEASAETNVLDQLMGTSVLGDQVGAAAHGHGVQLTNAGAIVDGAGRDGLTKFDRLPFQLEHCDQQGHGILKNDNKC